ncbi:MAG TPA: PBP1A family penicillin-binding protein [Firmicutes bacterium]|nr:PBP1A family penicillin-binding protein [Bacillota bacterium]
MKLLNIFLIAVTVLMLALTGSFSFFVYNLVYVSQIEPEPVPLTTRIYDSQDQLMAIRYLENRLEIPLEEIPDKVIQATLAIEDRHFYQHLGFDLSGLGRALVNNLKQKRFSQGGSTITQQLAKNIYLTNDRTLVRKIKEAAYTVHLEHYYKKDEILERYLNTIYYGHSAYGIEAAARTYFNKSASELSLAEAALLAGIPKGPLYYSPLINPSAAVNRQTSVLQAMVSEGYITESEKQAALEEVLVFRQPEPEEQPSYFVEYIINVELAKLFNGDITDIYRRGLEIYTTLDLNIQQAAEQTISSIPRQRIDHQGCRQPQGALVAIDPSNGYIKAMVGGRDFSETQLNRVFSRRSPGSAFKPIVYATALEQGQTAATTYSCQPISLPEPSSGAPYEPSDYGGGFHHRELTIREAIAVSCNIVAIKTFLDTGPENTVEMAARLGINSPLGSYYSLPLGTAEISLLELTAAFAPFCNGGIRVEPLAIRKVIDSKGSVLLENSPRRTRVLDEKVAFLITDMLTGVLAEGGTASNAGLILNRPAAGKSGTSQAGINAHMIGYTPDLLAGLYIGDDFEQPLGTTGGQLAAPLWAEFMESALKDTPSREFPIPQGVIRETICAHSGLLQSPGCKGPGREEFFIEGTAPTEQCNYLTCPHCLPDYWWPWLPGQLHR